MYPAIGPIDFAQGDSVASRLPVAISVTLAADIVYRWFGQLRLSCGNKNKTAESA
jgi:hypothetical protein